MKRDEMAMTWLRFHWRTALVMLVLAGLASAQVPPPPARPLDQGVGDAGPLSTSLRQTQPGLRQPAGFDNVYHVPGRDDLLMRIDGGVVAVFPRSTYVRTREGTMPTIPPGTVFYIGVPTHLSMGVPSPDGVLPGQQYRLGSRVAPRLDQPQNQQYLNGVSTELREWQRSQSSWLNQGSNIADATSADASRDSLRPVVSTMINDHTYRARRLEQLMQQAANAEAAQVKGEHSTPPQIELDEP